MEGTADRKVHKEIKERMGVLRTTLKKAEASMAESEDHLKESQIQEEEVRQGDQGQSNSSEGQDRDVVVEGAEESGPPPGVEATGPLRSQEAEPSMEVDVDDIPPMTSGDATTVTPKEDEMLMGDTTSMSGEMARLQVSSPESHKPEDGETPQ